MPSGGTEIFSSWVHFLPGTWYTLGAVPMVRMNFGTDISIPLLSDAVGEINCYPNPAMDAIQIGLRGFDSGAASLNFYDAAGSLVKSAPIVISSDLIAVALSDLAPGVYQLAIVSERRSASEMIVIQR
jgi:hypothetical protein